MGYINLSLYNHPSRATFDPLKVLSLARAHFPEAEFASEDELAAEVKRAEALFAEELAAAPGGPAAAVVHSLQRKAKAYGPALTFSLPLAGGGRVRGLARSCNVQFLFDDPLPDSVRRRLCGFLRAVGIGFLTASRPGDEGEETLAVLDGSSECLHPDGQAPWLAGSGNAS
jgi:hypothetical protein